MKILIEIIIMRTVTTGKKTSFALSNAYLEENTRRTKKKKMI